MELFPFLSIEFNILFAKEKVKPERSVCGTGRPLAATGQGAFHPLRGLACLRNASFTKKFLKI
jgi:hypothetical protein